MGGSIQVESWAVVIPSYRQADYTIACIDSLWSASPQPGHVVVVDDASRDGSVEQIESWARGRNVPVVVERGAGTGGPLTSWLTLIVSEANQGFVGTSNLGLVAARDRTTAPFVLLLNNDAVVTPSFLAELNAAANAHPHAGLLSGSIYEWDRSTIWFAGGRIETLRGLSCNETAARATSEPYPTDWISGCAMLISRAAMKRVGILSPCFSPIYSEDVDYSLRVRDAGFQLLIAPRAVAYHRVGQSMGQAGTQRPRVIYISNRNRVFVVRRHYRRWERVAALAYLAISKPLRAVLETVRGRPRAGWAVVAGTVDGMFNPAARR